MSREAREEEIRASVERAFREWDAAMKRTGQPHLETEVERVELRGSYPDTRLVVVGTDDDGKPIEREYELWSWEAFDWDTGPSAALLLVTEYMGG
jgi:hypothetical protein